MSTNVRRAPIAIVGATGNTGSLVARSLIEQGHEVIAIARSAARDAELAARGIPRRHGDLDRPGELVRALEGVERAYLVCTPDAHLAKREIAFIDAAQRAGVKRLVKCSAYGAGPDGSTAILRLHGRVESALRSSDLEFVLLRPIGFMQTFMLFNMRMARRAGVLSMPTGSGSMPFVDLRDVAAAAVRALTHDGHVGAAYDLTGPEALNLDEIAQALTHALGREVHYRPGSERALRGFLRLLGAPRLTADHVLTVMRLQREHAYETVSPALHQLGIEPTSFATFLDDWLRGETGGGNSFAPGNPRIFRLLDALMPFFVRLMARLPRRAAFGS